MPMNGNQVSREKIFKLLAGCRKRPRIDEVVKLKIPRDRTKNLFTSQKKVLSMLTNCIHHGHLLKALIESTQWMHSH